MAVSPEWVEYLESGIVQGDGADPAELPCPGLGDHSRELSVDGPVSPGEAEARRRSSTWSIVRRRRSIFIMPRKSPKVRQIMRTPSDSPSDRHFVSRSDPRQRTKEGTPASPADARCPFCPSDRVPAICCGAGLGPACHGAGLLASADCSGSSSTACVSDSE